MNEFPSSGGNITKLEVSSEGPFKLSEIVEDIENSSYYDGYDNDTLNWMKSLDDMNVFNGLKSFVIMDSSDARIAFRIRYRCCHNKHIQL